MYGFRLGQLLSWIHLIDLCKTKYGGLNGWLGIDAQASMEIEVPKERLGRSELLRNLVSAPSTLSMSGLTAWTSILACSDM